MEAVSLCNKGSVSAFTVTVCDAAPTVSWTFTAFACSGISCRLSMTFFSKPSFSTSKRKGAAGSALKLYTPASLLTLTCVSPVCGIGQREVGAGNDCARGVGHDALNGSSILRVRHGSGKEEAGKIKKTRTSVKKWSGSWGPPGLTLNAAFVEVAFTKTLEKRFSSGNGAYSMGEFSQSSNNCFRV